MEVRGGGGGNNARSVVGHMRYNGGGRYLPKLLVIAGIMLQF